MVERVFGMAPVPVAFPHYGGEKSGYAGERTGQVAFVPETASV